VTGSADTRSPSLVGRVRCAVTVEHLWHPVPGGSSRAANEILGALVRLDRFDFVGVAAAHRGPPPPAPVDDVRRSRLPRPLLYDSWHRLGRPAIESLTGPVDVVWASALAIPPSRAPIVVTVHDVEFLAHPEWLSRRGRTFYPALWRAVERRAARIVCPTELVAADVRSRIGDAERVEVIPLGVDPVRASPDEIASVRRTFGLPDRFALWVGTIEPRKNLSGVANAIALIDDLPLVVVGPPGWSVDGTDVLQPLGRRAIRLGELGDEHLRALYAAATVFVFPSFAEGFGLPVLEAMAQGTPVVTSAGTATEEVAGGAAVLVDPLDVESIADGIRQVVDDEVTAGRLGAAGTRRAGTLTWDVAGRRYADLFDRVVAR
jgi:glycosyltransferase involved in cell wall biosynthesis